MHTLSKSKILAYRQCHRRLWLEVRHPNLRAENEATEQTFHVGHQIGDFARQLYDPEKSGVFIDFKEEGIKAALARTQDALQRSAPVFEAEFSADGASASSDIMLPVKRGGKLAWRMVEVKSSTNIKDYYRDDVAIQAYVAKAAGVRLYAVSVAHIDSLFVYKGGESYDGLLVEKDLTAESLKRRGEVKSWIAEAQSIVKNPVEPSIQTGRHCSEPYECCFQDHCRSREPQAKYPASLLPRVQSKSLRAFLEENRTIELEDIPDELLNERQQRVKLHTLNETTFFDRVGAVADLTPHKLPAYFLDFETIQFAVPIWKGTRPYQQIPFQFSVHILPKSKPMEHFAFLDLSGNDPSKPFAEALIELCGATGPVFVYNAGFESARIKELAQRFSRLKKPLLAINKRLVDLLRVAEQRYYHPSQQGSWSIKKVLPAIAPGLRYDALEGVQDGGMAMEAYLEALAPSTPMVRKSEIERQLLAYCQLDTYAMVRIWQSFVGRSDLTL